MLLNKIDAFTKFIMQSKIQNEDGRGKVDNDDFKQMQQAAIKSMRMVSRNEVGSDKHAARRRTKKEKIQGEGGNEAD